MKRTLSLALAAVMMMGLMAGCAKDEPAASTPAASTPAASTPAASTPAEPEGWKPTKDVEMVIPASAGGGSDLWSRMMCNAVTANGISDANWVPLQKAGGAGAVGYNYCASKKGDSHTLLSLHSGVPVSSYVAGWENTFESYTDIICIMAMDDATICINANGPYKTFQDIVDAAKAAPGTIRFGSDQRLNISQYGYELIQKHCEIEMNYVQYDSSGDAATALLGGHVDLAILNPGECLGQVESGDFIVAATYAPERLGGLFADAPTFAELGYPEIVMREFRGLSCAVDTPVEAKQYYEACMKAAMDTPEFKEYCESRNLTPMWIGLDEAQKYTVEETEKIADLFAELGIQ